MVCRQECHHAKETFIDGDPSRRLFWTKESLARVHKPESVETTPSPCPGLIALTEDAPLKS